MLLLPLVVESIHYFWQGGVYLCFPLRNGYMPCMLLLFLTALLLEDKSFPKIFKSRAFCVTVCIAAVAALIPLSAFRIKRAELGYGKNKSSLYSAEIALGQALKPEDPSHRLMDKKGKIQLNFPLVSGVASQENWIHIIPALCQDECDFLGYRHDGSAIYGKGGTVFSDAVLGTRYVICDALNDERLYSPIAEAGGVQISECLYTLPFGFFMKGYSEVTDPISSLEVQNLLAKDIWGDGIFELIRCPAEEQIDISFENDSLVYFENMGERDTQVMTGSGSINAPARRISCLGIFNGETVFTALEEGKLAYVSLDGLFSKKADEAVSELKFSRNGMSCRVEHKAGDRYLFLPVNNIKGWECSLNGEKADTVSVYGGFMAVVFPEAEGIYELKLRYHPPFMAAGAVLCIAGIAILLADHRFKLVEKAEAAGKPVYYIFMAAAFLVFSLIYVADMVLLVIL